MDSKKTLTIKLVPDPSDEIGARVIVLKPGTHRVTVGRSSKVDFKKLHPAADNAFFDSRVMSRNHVEFTTIPKNQEVYIRDTNSMHGTLLNGVKLSAGEKKLIRSADMLTFGAQVNRGNDSYKPLIAVVELKWHEENRPQLPPRPKEKVLLHAKEHVKPSEPQPAQPLPRPKEKAVVSATEHAKPSEPQPAPRSRNTFVVPDNDDSEDEEDDDVKIVEPPTQNENTTGEEVGKEDVEEDHVEEDVDAEEGSESESGSESDEHEVESEGSKEDKKDTTLDDQGFSDSDSSIGDLLENHSFASSSPPEDLEIQLDDCKELSLKNAPHSAANSSAGVKDDSVLPYDANLKEAEPFANEAESRSRSVQAIEERGETRKEQDTGSGESIQPRDFVNCISVDNPTGVSHLPQKPSGPENARLPDNPKSPLPDVSTTNDSGSHRETTRCGFQQPRRGMRDRTRACIPSEGPLPGHQNMGYKCPPMQRKYIPNNYGPPPAPSFNPRAPLYDPYIEGPFSVDFTDFSYPPSGYGKEPSFQPSLGMPSRGFAGGAPQQAPQPSLHNNCPPPSGGYPGNSAPRELTEDSLNARLGRLVARMNEDNPTRNKSQETKTTALSVSRSDPRTILQETGESSLKRKRDYMVSGSAHENAGTKAAPAPVGANNDVNPANTGVQTTAAGSIEQDMPGSSENRDEDEPRHKRARTSSRGSSVTRYAVSVLAGAVVGGVGAVMGLAALPTGFFE